ncbi:MAG: Gfo/Idh/MocA family protein [Armatimonadota bacterium]
MTEPVRWGVLGCARVFERRMVPAFGRVDEAHLVAVASRDRAKAEAVAGRHGIPNAFGDYAALLADPGIDAVYLPLPNDLHARWVLEALAAGKHVLCDKPMVLTVDDAVRCAETARARGLRLMEGFMYRHHPQHARVRQLVSEGAIGRPVRFSGVFAYCATPDHAGIRWDPARGGGALTDVGVYTVDAARMLFDDEPEGALCVATMDTDTGVDLHSDGVLTFTEGRSATFSCGFDQAFASRYEIVGTEGSIEATRAFQVGEVGVALRIRTGGGDAVHEETFPHFDHWAQEIRHFCACVRDPAQPLSPGEDGVAQARVLEALRRSIASGCVEAVSR